MYLYKVEIRMRICGDDDDDDDDDGGGVLEVISCLFDRYCKSIVEESILRILNDKSTRKQ